MGKHQTDEPPKNELSFRPFLYRALTTPRVFPPHFG
jgi:hypothetical protein